MYITPLLIYIVLCSAGQKCSRSIILVVNVMYSNSTIYGWIVKSVSANSYEEPHPLSRLRTWVRVTVCQQAETMSLLGPLLVVALSSMVQGKYFESMGGMQKVLLELSPPLGTAQSRGELRLVRGSATSYSYTSGRLEIFMNGRWGTICNDADFGQREATVACQQLGWNGASSYGYSSMG